jgi:hypothetical protein
VSIFLCASLCVHLSVSICPSSNVCLSVGVASRFSMFTRIMHLTRRASQLNVCPSVRLSVFVCLSVFCLLLYIKTTSNKITSYWPKNLRISVCQSVYICLYFHFPSKTFFHPSSFPGATKTSLLEKINKTHSANKFYEPSLRNPTFVVKHYAGSVEYKITVTKVHSAY